MINFQQVTQFQALLAARQDLQLLAVAKNVDAQQLRCLYEHTGWKDYAESRLDALVAKKNQLRDLPLIWHYIGPLQSRKIKQIVLHCDQIQTVCRTKEMTLIEQAASQVEKVISIWIQIDYSKVAGRSGCDEDTALRLVELALASQYIQLEGLMTMALPDDCSAFNRLNQLREKKLAHLKCSMGMSGDFPQAIEQGSDQIRIGRALFSK